MIPAERDPAYLWDMLKAAREIQHFIKDVELAEYCTNRLLQMAIEREFTIIGEAAGRVSSGTRAMSPDVPWRSIIGKRNIIIHAYYEVDIELVFIAAVNDIPILINHLEILLKKVG